MECNCIVFLKILFKGVAGHLAISSRRSCEEAVTDSEGINGTDGSLELQFSLLSSWPTERHVFLDADYCFAQDHEPINMKTVCLKWEGQRQWEIKTIKPIRISNVIYHRFLLNIQHRNSLLYPKFQHSLLHTRNGLINWLELISIFLPALLLPNWQQYFLLMSKKYEAFSLLLSWGKHYNFFTTNCFLELSWSIFRSQKENTYSWF